MNIRYELANVIEELNTDTWTVEPSEYKIITSLKEAEENLAFCFELQNDCELSEEEMIPSDMTAKEFMKIWNCIVKKYKDKEKKEEAIKKILIKENYEFTFNNYLQSVYCKTGKLIHPYISHYERFYEDIDCEYKIKDFAIMVQRSKDFNPNHEYIWVDENNQLHSTNTIYPNIYDVDKVVEWIIENNDCLENDKIREILNK